MFVYKHPRLMQGLRQIRTQTETLNRGNENESYQNQRQSQAWNKRGGEAVKKAGSKQFPADSTATGNYYLTYTVNGKRITKALRDADGHPITDRAQAENERRRIMAPYAAGDAADTLKAIRAKLADAETRQAEAIENAAPVLKLADAWRAFERHPNRPQCSESTLSQYRAEFKRFAAWLTEQHPDAVAMRGGHGGTRDGIRGETRCNAGGGAIRGA